MKATMQVKTKIKATTQEKCQKIAPKDTIEPKVPKISAKSMYHGVTEYLYCSSTMVVKIRRARNGIANAVA